MSLSKPTLFSRFRRLLFKATRIVLFVFFSKLSIAQEIVWGEADEHDNPNISYEIIGRFDSTYLIYKSIRNSNYICVYNEDMQVIETHELEFLPSRMLDIDIIKNKQKITFIWQQEKNGVVSCFGTILNANMQQLVPVKLLDTTKVGQFAENKIYLTGKSEDKSKLLIYKRYVQKGDIRVMAKVYDNSLNMLDSSRFTFEFKSKKDFLSQSVIDNEGNVFFTIQHRSGNNQTYTKLGLFICRKDTIVKRIEIPLQDNRLLQSSLVVDNNHKRCIITADYSRNAKYRSDGVYVCYVDAVHHEVLQQNYVAFSDSVKTLLKPSGGNSYDEADYHPDFVLVKKNGALVIIKEDEYEEMINMINPWNNNMMLGNSGVFTPVDYYYSPYQSSFYNRNVGRARTRYYNNNIHVIQIDSSFQNQWLRVVSKNQYAEDDESFNSYFMLMQARELHFVYLANMGMKHVLSHLGVGGDGSIQRYPTLRGNGSAVEMLPRYAKQTSWNTCIMPFIQSGKLAFSKVTFIKN